MNRRLGVWLTGAAAAALMVAVSITGNQAYTDHGLRWAWLIGAITVAGLSVAIGQHLARSQPGGILRLTDDKGRPPRLGEVTLTDLGVQESRFSGWEQLYYIPREKDRDLADALQEGDRRLVIVRGPRLAGTTRTLAQAAQAILPDHRVVAFTVDQRLSMADMVQEAAQWARDWPGAVLWLDPLSTSQLEQIDRALLDALPDGLWVLATLHTGESTGYRAPAHVIRTLDEQAALIVLGTLTGGERAALRAEEAYRDLAPALDHNSDVLMGRLMVALDQIRNALTLGADETSGDLVSLLRAVTDWWRVGMPGLLSHDALAAIYKDYRRAAARLGPGAAVSTLGFDHALSWATSKADPSRPQLIDVKTITHAVQYVPHPLLAVIADDQETGWMIADALWAYAERTLRGNAKIRIGYTALDHHAFAHARNLLDPFPPTQVSPAALLAIARWLEEGDTQAARNWYAKVIATGDTDAAAQGKYRLGRMERELGNLPEARRWYTKAIRTKDPDAAPKAMNNLGLLESQQGNTAEGRRLLEQAIGTRHTDAAPRAMVNLGLLAWEQQDEHEARQRWEQAAEAGHPDMSPQAMLRLGQLDYLLGDYEQARRRWVQVIGTNHPEVAPQAMIDLAQLEIQHGNVLKARPWYEKAIDSKHRHVAPTAMYGLGWLEGQLGNASEARRWYTEAVQTKDRDAAPQAMTNLGILEWQEGNLLEARRLWEQAVNTAHAAAAPRAKIGLGLLEWRHGNTNESRRLLGEAIDAGQPAVTANAAVHLGVLELEQGNLAAARRSWEQAISTGIMPDARNARQLLGNMNRRQGEQQRAEQFAKYGWQAYANKELIPPIQPGEDEKQGKNNRPQAT